MQVFQVLLGCKISSRPELPANDESRDTNSQSRNLPEYRRSINGKLLRRPQDEGIGVKKYIHLKRGMDKVEVSLIGNGAVLTTDLLPTAFVRLHNAKDKTPKLL